MWIPKVYNGRNKSFWLANFEGRRTISGFQDFLFVPTPAQLAGRFTSEIIDPVTGVAFPGNVDFPSLEPALAPIIPIGSLAPTDPCRHGPGNPCRQPGWLVAYDSGPVVVGSWDITISAVPEPSGVALLGISILLVMRSERSQRRAVQRVRRSLG